MSVSDYLGILWLKQVETKLSETLLKYLRSVELFLTNFYRTIDDFYFSPKRFIDLYNDGRQPVAARAVLINFPSSAAHHAADRASCITEVCLRARPVRFFWGRASVRSRFRARTSQSSTWPGSARSVVISVGPKICCNAGRDFVLIGQLQSLPRLSRQPRRTVRDVSENGTCSAKKSNS